ncbi:MAG: flagellar type III secretion system pore protein FliP [Proteobacteria bacterium]|nr:flagellar type III secretion system pore protein FliP [Pseudomonadota bacterium]
MKINISILKKISIWLVVLGIASFLASDVFAQVSPVNINVDEDLLSSKRAFQLFMLVTILSLAPSILMMMTSFIRITVVFSFLRTALGLQSSPPNAVLVSLSFFLTLFVMSDTLKASYANGVAPYVDGHIEEKQAFEKTVDPFKDFMFSQVGEKELALFSDLAKVDSDKMVKENIPLTALIPAFMISELKRAFEIGFLIFLPFLIMDLAIASILMSMGMMMLPPVIISMPFKVIFFVLIDGWALLSSSLVQSFLN